jgi:hypothetical protein
MVRGRSLPVHEAIEAVRAGRSQRDRDHHSEKVALARMSLLGLEFQIEDCMARLADLRSQRERLAALLRELEGVGGTG